MQAPSERALETVVPTRTACAMPPGLAVLAAGLGARGSCTGCEKVLRLSHHNTNRPDITQRYTYSRLRW